LTSTSDTYIDFPSIIFAGTPEFAAIHLKALIDSGCPIQGVYTQPDRRAGRGKKLSPSPVKLLALEHNIPVYQPESFKDNDAQQQLQQLHPDLMIVVAYGLILPEAVLNTPKLGCVNMHGSLLPRWRGAAPIQRAIEAGDTTTGVCLMQLESGLDTGPVLASATLPILDTDNASDLHDRMAQISAQLLLDNLTQLLQRELTPVPQDHAKATYAHKLLKDQARVNWQKPATELALLIRAFNPWPVCFFPLDSNNIRIWKAKALSEPSSSSTPGTILKIDQEGMDVKTAQGLLRIETLQLPGKNPMPIADILRGNPHKFQLDQILE